MPKVSVIIPSYNCERYIKKTIDSILNQTSNDIEIIVVDDGSTDVTKDIISSYDSRVKLIAQANAGVSAARNRGIREASGEFICLMDHDDYWFPHKLARQVKEFQIHPEVGVVYSTFIRWYPDHSGCYPAPESYDLLSYPDNIDPDYSGWVYHQFLLDCWMLTSTAMFRAEVFEKCGLFKESLPYSEDWELWLRISRMYPFIQLRRPTTLYRQHDRQGNRIIRDVDYRTTLLTQTTNQWGLCSRDGRCVTRGQYLENLASYHAEFAFEHLKAGKRSIAIRSFINACICFPMGMKYYAYIVLACIGWKPGW